MESKAHSTSMTGYAWASVGGIIESASKLPERGSGRELLFWLRIRFQFGLEAA